MRTTHALVQVALVLMSAPDDRHWGYETARKAGVRSGVLYPMLTRMLDEGWVADGWEDPATAQGKRRPPRRYYELTEAGQRELGAILQAAKSDSRFASTRFRWA